jgi:hypothetical protein
MSEHEDINEQRPMGLTLLTGLYLFLLFVSATTYGNPFPLMGRIYTGSPAKAVVLIDCLICLYLLMGIMKRQLMTWYLLISYNLFEIANTIVNVEYITATELERVIGVQVNRQGLWVNNIAAALAMLLLTQYIYRSKHLFSNRQRYLF